MLRYLKLLIPILAGLVLIGAAVWFVYSGDRARAAAASQHALAARAQAVAQALDHNLQLRMVEVFTFAAFPSVRGYAASDETARPARQAVALSELQSIVAADPNVRAASISDANGIVVLTTDNTMKADKGQRLFVRDALAGHLHASVPARDFGEISQYYSSPILDNGGRVAGVLFVRVAVQELWNLLDAQGNLMVVDADGIRIADHSPAPQTFVALVPLPAQTAAQLVGENRYGLETTQIRATNLTDLASAVKRGKSATVSFHDVQGHLAYAALRPLQTNPWTVIAFESEDEALAAASDSLPNLVKVAAASVVVTVAVGYALRWLYPARQEISS